MLQVSNHDYQYVQEYRRMVRVYFMTADGLQDRFCESLLFSRCRYSRSQLGYRLECQSYGSTEPQIFVFKEFPRVIVTESITVFPEKRLYEPENTENGLLRYPLDDDRNLDIVCEWLTDHNCKYEELMVQNETIGGKQDEWENEKCNGVYGELADGAGWYAAFFLYPLWRLLRASGGAFVKSPGFIPDGSISGYHGRTMAGPVRGMLYRRGQPDADFADSSQGEGKAVSFAEKQ